MAVVQCKNAHYYDDEKYQQCPHCAAINEKTAQAAEAVSQARQIESYAAQYLREHRVHSQETEAHPREACSPLQGTAPHPQGEASHLQAAEPLLQKPPAPRQEDDEKTVSLYQKRGSARYTVGWLVCVEGNEYGRDFPLYAGFNRIGRAESNDVVLADMQVSIEEHCSVIYEQKKNIFYILPKAGSLVYVRDALVQQALEIESGEVIALGETKLELVAFCRGERRWGKKQ